MNQSEIENAKARVLKYQENAKNAVQKVLEDAGFKILTGNWCPKNKHQPEMLIFDYPTTTGHIEFSVTVSGWGNNCEIKSEGFA